MASFRFIHTADIHLDSPLRGLARHEGPAAERIRSATRQAFDTLISQTIEEEAAFIVIAGDLYDGDWRDFQTGLFFARQMGRLMKADIPAFVLYGNHDAESQITKRLSLPENVRVFGSRKPQTFRLKELGTALHGQSFRQRDVTQNLVPAYPEPVGGMFNIGVLHTGLGGMGGHENYAPCSLEDLLAKGYDYWALGHVHAGEILHERPHVVFPGNLQGRHIRETGLKGARLVTVDEGEVTGCTLICADIVRWARVPVALDECSRLTDAIEQINLAVEAAVSEFGDGRLLACRLELTGRTALHGELLASSEHLLAEARAAALGLGTEAAWIEKLVILTEPEVDPAAAAARQDALGELRQMLEQACGNEGLLRDLEADIGELARKLPPDLRREIDDPALAAAAGGDHAALIVAAARYLEARLSAGSR